MAWILIFLYLLLISPVRLGVALSLEGAPRAAVGVMVWGIPFQVEFFLERDLNGQLRLASSLPGRKNMPSQGLGEGAKRALHIIRAVKKANIARLLLRKLVHVRRIEIYARLHLSDAGQTALLSALLQGVSGLLPIFRFRIHPSFREKSTLQARCMIDSRLGMLFSAGLLGLVSYHLAAQKEEKTWIIPSGN